MNALHGYSNVHPISAHRAKITADNSIYAPQSHGDEIAHALREWDAERVIPATATQCGMVENADDSAEGPAYSWPARDGYFTRKADALPAIKSQAEIDDEAREFSPAAYVVMFAAVGVMGLIWGSGDLLVRGLIWLATWATGSL